MTSTIPAHEIEKARAYPIRDLWPRLGLPALPEHGNIRSPGRDDGERPDVQVGGEKNITFDHVTRESLDTIALARKVKDCGFAGAVQFILGGNGHVASKPSAPGVATYDYTGADGALVFQVVRYDPKDFRQRRPDGRGGWIWNLQGVPRVLYHQSEVLEQTRRAGRVYVPEGEKDVDRLRAGRLVATCNAGGAGKWAGHGYENDLTGVGVVILPDNDEPGQWHAQQVAAANYGVAASVKVLHLDGLPLKGDVSDWLDQGHTIQELEALADAAPEWAPAAPPRKAGVGPETAGAEVVVSPDEGAVCDQILSALAASDPELFQRAGKFVTIATAESEPGIILHGGLSIINSSVAWMRDRITRHCRLVSVTHGDDGPRKKHVHPSDWMPQNLLARTSYPGIKNLVGVASYPILGPSGIVTERGYDSASNWFVDPGTVATVKSIPTADDINQARAALHEVVEDFPFAHKAGEAACVGMVLSILARPSIKGPIPLFLFDAAVRGSGKTLLARILGLLATGTAPAAVPSVDDPEEFRKRVMSLLAAADPLVMLDNLKKIGGPVIDALLTSTVWSDRILGIMETRKLPNLTVWSGTGNNVELVGDIRRRVLPIRLEPAEENPETRCDFQHHNITEWVTVQQSRLQGAALTLLAGWHAAGRPDMGLTTWGSFEAWSGVVRSCLVWTGYLDPIGCRDDLAIALDPETGQLGALLQVLEDIGKPVTAKDLLGMVECQPAALDGNDCDLLKELSLGPKGPSARTLGRRMSGWRGRVAGGFRLVAVKADGGIFRFRADRIGPKNGFNGFNGYIPTQTQTNSTLGTGLDGTHLTHGTHFQEARDQLDSLATRGVVVKLDDADRVTVTGALTDAERAELVRLNDEIKAILNAEREKSNGLPY